MQEFIFSFMNKFGYIGIMFLIIIENIFPPIPSEVILCLSGFMTTYTNMTVIMVILSSTIGSIIGAIILYYIGKLLNKKRIVALIKSKIGKILCLKEESINDTNEWFAKKGPKAVFFSRFIPIMRSLISIPAGMSEMPMLDFLVLTTLGTIIWNTILVFLGYKLGKNWELIINFTKEYKEITWVILNIIIILFILKKVFIRNKKLNKF